LRLVKLDKLGKKSIVKSAVAGAAVVSIPSLSIIGSFPVQPLTVRNEQKLKCHKKKMAVKDLGIKAEEDNY